MTARRPTSLKVLSGTYRRDREPAQPVSARAGRARAPSTLPAAEKAAFKFFEKEVYRLRIPTASFTPVLTATAIAWVSLEQSTATIAAKGQTYETTTTTGALKIALRPEVGQRNTALRLLKGYLVELGLTPAALGKVDRAALPKAEGVNPFATLDDDRKARRFFGINYPGAARGVNPAAKYFEGGA